MKKGLQFLAVLIAFLFVSCEKDGLNYTERQIVGTWDYTKVRYTNDWSVSASDLTYDYVDIQLTFNSDFSATYINQFTGESSSGLWELSQANTDDNCVNMIYASFVNDESGELSQVVFENAVINSRTIRALYDDKDGRYRYVLKQ